MGNTKKFSSASVEQNIFGKVICFKVPLCKKSGNIFSKIMAIRANMRNLKKLLCQILVCFTL